MVPRTCSGVCPAPCLQEPCLQELVQVVDLVLFHAVVEWMADAESALEVLSQCLKPGGHLSCLFYNRSPHFS